MSCFICQKHAGQVDEPPGGYLYEDEHWMVCHFPTGQAVLGQLVIESKRHFLDFSDMTPAEAATYGILMKTLYSALKQATGAERIYTLVMLEGIPHFHAHIVPRRADGRAKGIHLLSQNASCDEREAVELVQVLRRSCARGDELSSTNSLPSCTVRGRLHHVEINVSNLQRSSEFWGWLLEHLGYEPYQNWTEGRSWRKGDTYLVLVQTEGGFLESGYHRKRTGLNHLAFYAESRQQVDEFTGLLRGKAIRILYEDRHPYAGGPEHYAVFFEDPDRIKVEIVAPS